MIICTNVISIHALLAESDFTDKRHPEVLELVFLSTLSLRRATDNGGGQSGVREFLSTLSLRRAT